MGKDDFVLLITAANETESSMFRAILLDNGIDSYSKTRGMGSCYAISGLLSVDIYVSEHNLDRAKKILLEILSTPSSTQRIYLSIFTKKPIRRLKKVIKPCYN